MRELPTFRLFFPFHFEAKPWKILSNTQRRDGFMYWTLRFRNVPPERAKGKKRENSFESKANFSLCSAEFIVHALKKESLCVSVLGVGVKIILVARRAARCDRSISCFCRFVNSGR